MKKALFLGLITIFALMVAGFAQTVEAKPDMPWKQLGAHFTVNEQPDGWLPPLDYKWYFIGDPLSASPEVIQHLKDNGKFIGVKGYFSNPEWVVGRMDGWLKENYKYIQFITIFEENRTEDIPYMNAVYDHIKAQYPRLEVYQWMGTNKFDFNRVGELKADGFVINPRWWWAGQGFETYFLNPVLATGKPVLNLLYVGLGADMTDVSPRYTWEYAIGQYQVSQANKVAIMIYQVFYPGWEEIIQTRLKEILGKHNE